MHWLDIVRNFSLLYVMEEDVFQNDKYIIRADLKENYKKDNACGMNLEVDLSAKFFIVMRTLGVDH